MFRQGTTSSAASDFVAEHVRQPWVELNRSAASAMMDDNYFSLVTTTTFPR